MTGSSRDLPVAFGAVPSLFLLDDGIHPSLANHQIIVRTLLETLAG